jgi:anti-sigma regulatory factor (Ser/Thr protein kinase)
MTEVGEQVRGVVPAEATFTGSKDSIPAIMQFVSAFAEKQEFLEVRIKEVGWALEEALGNVVEYSCGPEGGNISIYCTMNNVGQLIVAISDEGKPFNMLMASDPLFDSDLPDGKRPSTRKMRRYASNVEARRSEGKNVLTFAVSRVPVGS